MEEQIDKDIKLKKQGLANPHWHFEHDPSKAPEMKPLLEKWEKVISRGLLVAKHFLNNYRGVRWALIIMWRI